MYPMRRKLLYIFLSYFISCIFIQKAFCATAWINDMQTLFSKNNAIIYAINIRTFNANDKNNNGIIEETLGEEKGTFLNAINKLDELKYYGINTIHLLPITPTGRVKALGTAGSLYACTSFSEINPQLKSLNSNLTINDEAKKFINECHKRNIRVIVDLPCCGAYDLYLSNPQLFKKDSAQNPIVPSDWSDVRILDVGTNETINNEVYNLYRDFIDLMQDIDADGIVADVATIKPYSFWKKLIDETKFRNPQFLFIAQATNKSKPISEHAPFTSLDKLLDAGFDGYYGNYSELKNCKTSWDLFLNVKYNFGIYKNSQNKKSSLGDFATHDEVSPILINGSEYSKMIIWLNSTLPVNAYYTDGFATGDNYMYPLMNKKASKTYTDDEYYFVHRGQLDIFNFSRQPKGKNNDILEDLATANRFKMFAAETLSNGDFKPLHASTMSVFAYSRNYNDSTVIVIGNLDFKKNQPVDVYISKINNKVMMMPVKINSIPKVLNGKIKVELKPGETQVYYIKSFKSK